MKLGEKIRLARLNAGMTQSELAGDFITRNMLSQIENGLAMPSLQTALYIADRLGLDAGVLFSEGDDKSVYFVTRKLPELKKLFADGEYGKCIEVMSDEKYEYDEANLLMAECHIRKAYELFGKGKLRAALKSGDAAMKYAADTIYSTDGIKHKTDILEVAVSSVTPYIRQTGFSDEAKEYLLDCFVENSMQKELYKKRTEAHKAMGDGKYSEALAILKELMKEKTVDVPLEYGVYCDLETCFRELGDYENAYKFSQMAKSLFEAMQQ